MIWSVALVVGMIWLAFKLARSETGRSRGDAAGGGYMDGDHGDGGGDAGDGGGGNGGD